MYFGVFAAFAFYHLLEVLPAFALMMLVTLGAGILAVRLDSMLVVIFGIVGGYMTPILLSSGQKNFTGLFGYMLLLGLGILGVNYYKKWHLLNYLSFAFNYLLFFGALTQYRTEDFWQVMPFLTAFFALYSTLVFFHCLMRKSPSNLLDLLGLLVNAGIFFETPYLLEKFVETREEILQVPHAGEVVDMKPKNDGIEILLRTDKTSQPTDGFTVHTPLHDYEYRVQVLGFQDGEHWMPLVEDAHIDRIEFWHNVKQTRTEAARSFPYPVTAFSLQQDKEKRATVITLTSRKEPLTQLILHSTNRNFSRKASLQVPQPQGVHTQWREVAQASLQSLSFQNVQREQTAIDFPEQRQAEYRIILYDQDAPPLPIDAIVAQGNRYQLLFLAQPGKTYRLHYGTENAQAAHYDTTALTELRRSYAPQEAALGPQQDLSPSSDLSLGKLLNSTAFFIVAILLMLALLVWSVLGIARRINRLEE